MLKRAILILPLLLPQSHTAAQAQPNKEGTPVEVIATASEYIPRSVTFSHPGHAYTNCSGSTSYFGRFNSYGDSGSISGTADTSTSCSTTSYPPTESTFTVYRKVNWTVVRSDHALYLLSCTQKWRWSKCPSFGIGANYQLAIDKSHVLLSDTTSEKPAKLDYVSSVALPLPNNQPAPPAQAQTTSNPERAKVHITSTPTGAEIFIDGKFFGNTPSDLTLPTGEHGVRVTLGGKEWSRSVQITSGEISIHSDLSVEAH